MAVIVSLIHTLVVRWLGVSVMTWLRVGMVRSTGFSWPFKGFQILGPTQFYQLCFLLILYWSLSPSSTSLIYGKLRPMIFLLAFGSDTGF